MMYTPLKMKPVYKEYLWGGVQLKTKYSKQDAPAMTAESWELASHPEGMSVIDGGVLRGKTIADLGELDKTGFWGVDCREDRFPVLVKLINAEKSLSIQVHPSDETAGPGERGKAEMWYIVDCEPQAYLYYGFSRTIDAQELLERVNAGTICEVLNKVPVSKGDVFYILPGTIHAIGPGIVVAEIQQNSNTTFRVYDYQRKDADGKLRELHLERALDVLDFKPLVVEECKVNNAVIFPEFTMSEMFTCRYFRAYRIDVRRRTKLACDGKSFQHLLCVDGRGTIYCNGEEYPFERGNSFFMPAAMGEYSIEGACRMLLSRI